MKKFRFLLTLLALVCTVAATAFTMSPEKERTDDPMLHWFDPSGNYLGYRSVSTQENDCAGTGAVCANGFLQVDEQGQPVDPENPDSITEKQQ